jgi:hypothetical protein
LDDFIYQREHLHAAEADLAAAVGERDALREAFTDSPTPTPYTQYRDMEHPHLHGVVVECPHCRSLIANTFESRGAHWRALHRDTILLNPPENPESNVA